MVPGPNLWPDYTLQNKHNLLQIKKCNKAISRAAEVVGTEDWVFAKGLVNRNTNDTTLCTKLYIAHLSSIGTSVKVSFTKDMLKTP